MTLSDEAAKLAETHGGLWAAHPEWPVRDWQYEVQNDDTRLGYWEWVANQIDANR